MEKILQIIKKLIPKKLFKAFQPTYHFAFSYLAALIYGFPSEKLIVIGITGTTGKTTSAYLTAKMLGSAGVKTGLSSTAIFNDGQNEWNNDKKMTMPGRFFTQKMLRRMLDNGCAAAIVETTSEGIRQFRHRFINYDITVFTGLYEEHIDSHGSFDNYKKAKGELFRHLSRGRTKYTDDKRAVVRSDSGLKKIGLRRMKKTIIANGDDEHAAYFLGFMAESKIAYSLDKDKKYQPDIDLLAYSLPRANRDGLSFRVGKTGINLKIPGVFNAQNAMNAIGIGLALGLEPAALKTGLEKITGVPGRLERIDAGQDFTAIVDYAFEPRALEKLYETLELIPHRRIIHILGSAGGGRDIARRPKLGAIAGQNADYVIVSNEDPYDDDPGIIIDQVALGAEKAGKKPDKDLFKILDRQAAMEKAVSLAGQNDLLIVTGKGNEKAICLANGQKLPWDDREVLRSVIKNKKKLGV